MPSKRIRKYLKTTGIDIVATCGHTYKQRVNVPYNLVSKVREPKLDSELNKNLNQQRKEYAKSICPNCEADTTINDARGIYDEIYRLSGGYKFSELIGPKRIVAYAESIRLQHINAVFREAERESVYHLRNPRLMDILYYDSIKKFYPYDEEKPYGEQFETDIADIEKLLATLSKVAYYYGSKFDKKELLAFWLTVTGSVTHEDMLYELKSASNPKLWIGSNHSKHSPFPNRYYLASPTASMVAIAIAKIPGWESLRQAQGAFITLAEPYSETAKTFLRDNEGEPFIKTLKNIQVLKALTPVKPDPWK
jgi:hypothetical protein